MKKLLFVLLFLFFFMNTSSAQEPSKWTSENSFIEWNIGIAFIEDFSIPFPGTSVLWGKTFINKNDFIFEYEAGLAFPSLVTAKIGIGKQYNNTKITFGIRPLPFHLYTQASFSVGENGYWITSLEVNPLGTKSEISFGSLAILNFGYRWNLDRKD